MKLAPAIAIGSSLLAHALFLLFARTRDELPQPEKRESVTITLVAPKPPETPRPPPLPAPPPVVPQVRKVLRTPKAPPSPAPTAEPPTLLPATPAPPVVETAPKVVTPPSPPGPETNPALPKVDLFSPLALSKSAERGFAVAPRPEDRPPDTGGRLPGELAGEHAKTEAERVAARIAGTSIDANARSRVRAGLVDPTYARIGRALLDSWDPERALPEDSVSLWTKQRAQNALISGQLMLETAKRYAATGSPMVDGETLDEAVRSDRHDATSQPTYVDQQRTRETFRQYMKGKFNEGRSAQLLVEETPDGKIRVSIVKASGDNDVDRGATEDIRLAIERLHADQGVPAKARRTVWAFRLQIIIVPPVPVAGFEWDEVIDNPKLELPLGRKLLKHVELQAVYDDDPRLAGQAP